MWKKRIWFSSSDTEHIVFIYKGLYTLQYIRNIINSFHSVLQCQIFLPWVRWYKQIRYINFLLWSCSWVLSKKTYSHADKRFYLTCDLIFFYSKKYIKVTFSVIIYLQLFCRINTLKGNGYFEPVLFL